MAFPHCQWSGSSRMVVALILLAFEIQFLLLNPQMVKCPERSLLEQG